MRFPQQLGKHSGLVRVLVSSTPLEKAMGVWLELWQLLWLVEELPSL